MGFAPIPLMNLLHGSIICWQSFACGGKGIKPNITFNIETPSGKVLQSYSTGDIPENLGWKQYGFFFATTVDINSVILRMTNNAPGGCGNDILPG